MARPLRVVLFGALLATFAASAGEDVYRWVDEAGEEHYTDDASTIPRQFRKSAKKVEEPPVTRLPSTPSPGAGSSVEGRAYQGADAGTRDLEAEAERRWRSQFGDARRRIAELERQIQADSELLDGGTLLPLYTATGQMVINPEAAAATSRLELNEKELVRARQDLEDLERRARWDAVPLEWRRGE